MKKLFLVVALAIVAAAAAVSCGQSAEEIATAPATTVQTSPETAPVTASAPETTTTTESTTTTTTAAPTTTGAPPSTARPAPPTTRYVAPTTKPATTVVAASPGNGQCGGTLPPCYVMNRESGGNPQAKNPTSSASGKWQALDSTWQGYGGYARAMDAPESVQDDFARRLWDGGRGCSHWSAC